MRYRLAQAAVACITLVLLAPILYFTYVFALGQYKYQEKVKVDGKEELVAKSVSYFREGDFWRPVQFMVILLIMVGIMFFVSSKKSRLVPGALVGVAAMISFCFVGQKLWPKGDLEVFLHGFGTISLVLTAFGVTYGAVYFGGWLTARNVQGRS